MKKLLDFYFKVKCLDMMLKLAKCRRLTILSDRLVVREVFQIGEVTLLTTNPLGCIVGGEGCARNDVEKLKPELLPIPIREGQNPFKRSLEMACFCMTAYMNVEKLDNFHVKFSGKSPYFSLSFSTSTFHGTLDRMNNRIFNRLTKDKGRTVQWYL